MPPSLLVTYAIVATALTSYYVRAEALPRQHISFKGPFEVEVDGIQNINIAYNNNLNGELTIVYGSCDPVNRLEATHHVGSTHVGDHPLAKRHDSWKGGRPTKFVWTAPADIERGCLHALLNGEPVGRSKEYRPKKRRMKKRATFADVSDPMGPWFDGVEYLKQKDPNETFVAATKNKKFGILGGGISGLLTAVSLTGACYIVLCD